MLKKSSHQSVLLKYEHHPPKSNQALPLHTQISCQGQILQISRSRSEREAPLVQTESDQGFLCLTGQKMHQIP